MWEGVWGVTYKEIGCEHGHMHVTGVISDKHKGSPAQQRFVLSDMLVDLGLALEMRHGAFATGDVDVVGEGAPDVMFERDSLGCSFGGIDALGGLNLNSLLGTVGCESGKEIGHGEDCVRSLSL